jgi:hypothetical protein
MIRFQEPSKTVCVHYLGVSFLDEVAWRPDIQSELQERPWKFVVLQAQKISMSGKYNYSRTEAIDYAKQARLRGAAAIFYPEWGLQGVSGDGERQETVYREMALEAEAGVAPVARAWDLALAERPELPLHSADGNHQSSLGAFLTACVLTGRITGNNPIGLAAYPYSEARAADRQFLAEIARRALAEEFGN